MEYKTPGVYTEEIQAFPPSIAAVETAIPAFIGYTEKSVSSEGDPLELVPTRITSLLEFEQLFGTINVEQVDVVVEQETLAGVVVTTDISFDDPLAVSPSQAYLYYCMKMFYANGGGPCYIVSIGGLSSNAPAAAEFQAGITELEKYDEPTLLVFPDACMAATDIVAGTIAQSALAHCNKMQDRFTILDVYDAIPGETDDNATVTSAFRDRVVGDLDELKYGAAYYPYLETTIKLQTDDDNIVIASHNVTPQETGTPAAGALDGLTATAAQPLNAAVYNMVKEYVATNARTTLPPSGAIAGIYARVDNARGVWKAPANVPIKSVISPSIKVTNDLNDDLNVDTTSGKSVNVIRTFTGQGTLVWGARTLAGNDLENRYISVRRFLNMVEESVKKASGRFVFEPNDANTWVMVRSMIENFLTVQWRNGALAGAKPDDAFYVNIGLNQTMTATDILEGKMIIEIGMAIVRPAEFIIIRYIQKLQTS